MSAEGAALSKRRHNFNAIFDCLGLVPHLRPSVLIICRHEFRSLGRGYSIAASAPLIFARMSQLIYERDARRLKSSIVNLQSSIDSICYALNMSMSDAPQEVSTPAETLSELECLLGYHFKNQALLLRALTHRSYVNEHETDGLKHNESMEFLGDAVLGFVVSSRIYRLFPDLTEGDLSKIKAYLVSSANLLLLAESLRLGGFLRLSRGEDKTGGRGKRAILVDAYESILGAIYLDGGVEAAFTFLDGQLGKFLERLDLRQFVYGDFKSALQEQLHDLGRPEPVYRVVDEIGPDHKKTFVVQVLIHDKVVAEAKGRTKKEAQQEAARLALEQLKD